MTPVNWVCIRLSKSWFSKVLSWAWRTLRDTRHCRYHDTVLQTTRKCFAILLDTERLNCEKLSFLGLVGVLTGRFVLQRASMCNHPEIIRLMVTQGRADPQDRHRDTGAVALHEAAARGHHRCVQVCSNIYSTWIDLAKTSVQLSSTLRNVPSLWVVVDWGPATTTTKWLESPLWQACCQFDFHWENVFPLCNFFESRHFWSWEHQRGQEMTRVTPRLILPRKTITRNVFSFLVRICCVLMIVWCFAAIVFCFKPALNSIGCYIHLTTVLNYEWFFSQWIKNKLLCSFTVLDWICSSIRVKTKMSLSFLFGIPRKKPEKRCVLWFFL